MSVHEMLGGSLLAVVATLGACAALGGHSARPPSAVARAAAPDTSGLAGLPLVESPAAALGDSRVAILLTGDGGAVAADRAMAAAFNRRGISVVLLDSRRYLQTPRTPPEASHDLARILRHYVAAWRRPDVLIVGYSRGAVIAPFMVNGLPPDLRRSITLVALLGPSANANFHFHWIDLVKNVPHDGDLPLLPELEKLRGTPVVCVYGSADADAICPKVAPALVRAVRRTGGHALKRADAEEVVGLVLASAGAESGG